MLPTKALKMNSSNELPQDNPIETENFVFNLFFVPLWKLYKKSANQSIHKKDLFSLPKDFLSHRQHEKFDASWNMELQSTNGSKSKPSLLKVLVKVHWKALLICCVISSIDFGILRPFQCVTIKAFIKEFSNEHGKSVNTQVIIGSVIFITSLLILACSRFYLKTCLLMGVKLRAAITVAMYRKVLKLSCYSLSEHTTGKIISHFSTDLNQVGNFAVNVGHIASVPLHIIISSYLLWLDFGIALYAVLAFFFILLTVDVSLGLRSSKLRTKIAEKSVIRLKIINEILLGIKVIKMYTWEKPFEKIVALARHNELKFIRDALISISHQSHYLFPLSQFNIYIAILAYTLFYGTLSAPNLFYLMTLLHHWRINLMYQLPIAITSFLEIQSSLNIIQDFLLQTELPFKKDLVPSNPTKLENVSVVLPKSHFELRNNTLTITKGSLCTLFGEVGSGKTSLLHLLLKELTPDQGKVEVNMTVSYASQDAWLFDGTIRENILLGQQFQGARYNKVVKACNLEADFLSFAKGDLSLAGERGQFLSGGQKARINLARALYRDADLYLLDDPLSAVDTKVGRHLFNNCIMDFLKGKTVILVTHQIQYLESSDLVLMLDKGKLEIIQDVKEFESHNNQLSLNENPSVFDPIVEKKDELLNEITTQEICLLNKSQSGLKIYLRSGGCVCFITSIFLSWLLAQIALTAFNFWASCWVSYKEMPETNLTPLESWLQSILQDKSQYNGLKILSAISLAMILIPIIITSFWFRLSYKASKTLHQNMVRSIMSVSIKFFDSNPTGTILNRFSNDVRNVDEDLPAFMAEVVLYSLVLLFAILTVVITNYCILLFVILAGVLLWKMLRLLGKTTNQIEQLCSEAQSQILSYITNSLLGIVTIRANNSQNILLQEFIQLQNSQNAAQLTLLYCIISFAFWIDLLYCIFLVVVVLGYILINMFGIPLVPYVNEIQTGLGLSSTLVLFALLQYTFRRYSHCLNCLPSVQRIKAYVDLDPEESSAYRKAFKKSSEWLSQGRIEYKNVTLKYNIQSKPVFTDINFTIQPKEKIGIVGRTGVGKSSLTSLLFRLTNFEGVITIDGTDIKLLSLAELRKQICIIPQDPLLFSESIRFNLDPSNDYKDEEIWNALDEVELRTVIPSLSYEVSEGGKNFSLGQRQLICLARAVLRKSKIVVIDEATANVDQRNDKLIQNTIRRVFRDCTVLTIAHRLQSIMDYDKILVMDSGGLAEFEHAHTLLSNPDSTLYKMSQETGQEMLSYLKEKAHQNHERSIDKNVNV